MCAKQVMNFDYIVLFWWSNNYVHGASKTLS